MRDLFLCGRADWRLLHTTTASRLSCWERVARGWGGTQLGLLVWKQTERTLASFIYMDVLLLKMCVAVGWSSMWAMGGQSQPLTTKDVDRQVMILTLPFSSFPLGQSFIQASLTLYKYQNVRKLLSWPVNKFLIIKWDTVTNLQRISSVPCGLLVCFTLLLFQN